MPSPLLRSHAGARSRPGADIAFAFVLAGFLAYAGAFIYRTSFLVGGRRYFSLFDDAMVSMRYARNLARGYGLVWNPGGARVEGFTNPLWVLFMAAIHRLPVPLADTSLIVQLTAAALLAINLYLVWRMAHAIDGSRRVALGATILTASYLPLDSWSLQGMEVSVLTLIVTAALWLCTVRILARDARPRDEHARSSSAPLVLLYVLLGLSTWVRPDMAVTLAGLTAFMALADRPRARRHVAWGAGALAAGLLTQTIMRLWYFHALLPNTYYLKMTGYPAPLRIARGALVLARFVWRSNPLLFAVAALSAVRGGRRVRLLAGIVCVQAAYSVYVGGDAWEYWGGANRYISIAMPAFFILLSSGLADLARLQSRRVGAAAFAVLIALSLASMNSIYGAGALREALLITPPLHSGPGGENHRDVVEAIALRAAAAPTATIAVTRAGTIPYFSDLPAIDLLGKTDAHIAHERARVEPGIRGFTSFRPGHSKYDEAYSLGTLRPDLVLQIWGSEAGAAPYLDGYRRVQIGPACVFARILPARADLAALSPCTTTEAHASE